jgi:two-component sensor histidine kinase
MGDKVPVKKGWGGAPAIRLTIGLMLAAFITFVALLSYFISLAIQQNQARLEEHTAAAAQVVSTNAFWIAEVANQTLRRVDTALGPFMSGTDASIESVLDGLPKAAETYVIDANANTIFSTVPDADRYSVADREYFSTLKDGASFYTSPHLISRITGDDIFVFSRRVTRNGAFAGAIMISFSESLLHDLLKTLDLPEGSTVSLVRDDGKLMARSPSAAEEDVDLSTSVLFTKYLPEADTGTYSSQASPVDGIARIVGYRRVPNTQIIAVASIASGPSWQALHTAILTVLLIVSPMLIGLLIGCWWIVKLLRAGEERNGQLQDSVDLNTMLFREIHHRVKNNLASIQALVRMQNIPPEAKRNIESRFAAMAAMHEHIYKHDRYEDINAADFIPAVIGKVIEAYGADVTTHYDLDNVAVDRDHATPLALLLNELTTNSLKYALAPDQAAEISISLRFAEDNKAHLVFRDNGLGLPEVLPAGSMGMRIIRGAVGQMGGSSEFTSDNGAVFVADLTLTPDGRAAQPSVPDPAHNN